MLSFGALRRGFLISLDFIWDTVVPNKEQDYISSFWGIAFYIRNIISHGSSTKKTHYSRDGELEFHFPQAN